jgi:putative membrane-bound dehydrogenase-like protein
MSPTPTPRWLAYGSVLLCALGAWAQTPPPAKPVPVLPPEPTQEVVTKVINLLDHVRDGKMDYHINPKADIHGDPKDVYKLQPDGALRVSGEGYGSMVTKGAYKDYHLVCEFKWGEKTWGNRTKRSRDNGILVHCFGPIGAQGGAWMASIEAQIIEGGVGDILVLSAKTPDGIPLPVSISAELGRDRDKEAIWTPGAPRVTMTGGRLNWQHRDVDWKDNLGYRGRKDVESPFGEWTRFEVIAKGDTLEYFTNGVLVNRAFECKPSGGRILLQTEAAEMFVRRYELHPLGAFTEKWTPPPAPPQKTTATPAAEPVRAKGVPAYVARPVEMTLTKGQGAGVAPAAKLPPGFELINAVPAGMVAHPTLGCVDAQGRLFVGDSPGVAWGVGQHEKERAGRIVMLEDRDGDGVFDRSTVFADRLTVPKGACWANGALYVASPPGIWKFTDADGDGVAEKRALLVGGFQWSANGADVHGPWLHPDGRLYWTHGRKGHEVKQQDGTLVHKGLASGVWSMRLDGSDVRWHSLICGDNPTGLAFAPTGEIFGTCNLYNGVPRHDTIGQWQLGGIYTRPDWLHIVADQLRTHEKMPLVANLGHMVPSGCALWSRANELAPALAASPENLQLMVSLYNSQKVIRLELQKEGAGYRASEQEFLSLTKTGAHLTDVVEAPDGSLLVLDTGTWYPHCPSSLLNSANVPGGIYRVRPIKPVTLAPAKPSPYRVLSDEDIARDLASADPAVARRACEQLTFRMVGTPAARAALLELLDKPLDAFLEHAAEYAAMKTQAFGVGQLKAATSPRQQARLLRILSQVATKPEDLATVYDFAATALDAAEPALAANAVAALGKAPDADARVGKVFTDWLAASALSDRRLRAFEQLGTTLASGPRVAEALAVALSKQGPVSQVALKAIAGSTGKLPEQQWRPALLALLGADPSPVLFEAIARVKHRSFDARLNAFAAEKTRPAALRLRALLALSDAGSKLSPAAFDLLLELLADAGQAGPRIEAARRLSEAQLSDAQLDRFLPVLMQAGPIEQADFLRNQRKYTPEQGKRIAKAFAQSPQLGTLQPDEVRVAFAKWPRPVFEVMEPAFNAALAATEAKKSKLDALAQEAVRSGRPEAGAKLFAAGKGACLACHQVGEVGRAIGPNLSRIGAIRTERELIESILFPSNTLARDYELHAVVTADARNHVGLIKSRVPDGLVLMDAAGQLQTLPPTTVVSETQLETSLMPGGLDAAFTPAELADLVAWLRSLR